MHNLCLSRIISTCSLDAWTASVLRVCLWQRSACKGHDQVTTVRRGWWSLLAEIGNRAVYVSSIDISYKYVSIYQCSSVYLSVCLICLFHRESVRVTKNWILHLRIIWILVFQMRMMTINPKVNRPIPLCLSLPSHPFPLDLLKFSSVVQQAVGSWICFDFSLVVLHSKLYRTIINYLIWCTFEYRIFLPGRNEGFSFMPSSFQCQKL